MSVAAVSPNHVPQSHTIELYPRAAFPAAAIAHGLAEALRRGGAAGALASAGNLVALQAALGNTIVEDHLGSGRLLLLDADAIHAALAAEPTRRDAILERSLGVPVRRLVERFGPVRLYGELVDLFCRSGDREGALDLEKWWNRQLEELPVELHCGYSVESFDSASAMGVFRRICDEHGHVTHRAHDIEPARMAVEVEQLSVILDLEVERRAAVEAAELRTREHLAVLQHITSLLCEAATYAGIGQVVTRELASALAASRSMLVIGGELIAIAGVAVWKDANAIDRVPGDRYSTLERPDALAWFGGDTIVVLPLERTGERLGTLVLAFGCDDPPVQLVDDLARQVLIAVERARTYELVERERERAEAASSAKDRFLAMLGHELRNPLSPILTAAQLMRLRMPELLEKERAMIERSVTHMMRIVDDLLDIAKIAHGNITLLRGPIEAGEIVAQSLELASEAIEDRGHRVQVSVQPQLVVDADATRITQVIANLISNAAKYTRNGGTIDITAAARNDLVEIVVTDNGMGIAADVLPHVFEPFVQGPPNGTRGKCGLGLGLAIAKTIVELHGGTIRAASGGPSLGSRFAVTLPRWQGTDKRDHAGGKSRDPTGEAPSGKRIMVVDDNEDAAWLLAEALRFAGHEVVIAYDGLDALERARTYQPELAFLDVGLPTMDGYALCRHMIELPLRPKLVAITGYGQAADRARALAAGFDIHFVKPVSLREVHSAIAALSQK